VLFRLDFPGGQLVYFTDNGWSGSALFNNEQTVEWTLPPQGLPAGTTVQFRNLDDVNTLITPSTAGGTNGVLRSLSAAGEQILAYSGSPVNPSFIAGISSSNWLDICDNVEGNTNGTCLPEPLIIGVNAFEFTGLSAAVPNGFFNLANFNGSPQDLLAFIMNVNNWTLDNSANTAGYQNWPAWNFIFGAGTTSNVQFASSDQTIAADASPISVGINILPASTVNGQISVSYTLSQGLTNADFSLNQTVSNNTFNLNVSTGTNAAAFQITLDEDLASNITNPQTITFVITSTSDATALQIGAINIFTFTVNPASSGPIPVLFINELMAQNSMTIADENGEFDDWIEIYNPNDVEVDLAGLYITDNLSIFPKYQFPFGSELTKIPANGFRLVWADNQDSQGPLHTNFGLSVNGEAVGLYAADGSTVIDTITFGVQQTDISFGRQQDGQLPWVSFTTPTPGASNNPSNIKDLMNEDFSLFPNPSSEQAFLFNKAALIENATIIISDINGRQLNISSGVNLYPNTGLQLSTEQLSNGIYFVTLQNDEIKLCKKLIINK
jgi:hypothetical protein